MLNTAIVCHGAVVIMWWSWKCILRYTAVVIGTALLVNYSCLRKRKFDKEKEVYISQYHRHRSQSHVYHRLCCVIQCCVSKNKYFVIDIITPCTIDYIRHSDTRLSCIIDTVLYHKYNTRQIQHTMYHKYNTDCIIDTVL